MLLDIYSCHGYPKIRRVDIESNEFQSPLYLACERPGLNTYSKNGRTTRRDSKLRPFAQVSTAPQSFVYRTHRVTSSSQTLSDFLAVKNWALKLPNGTEYGLPQTARVCYQKTTTSPEAIARPESRAPVVVFKVYNSSRSLARSGSAARVLHKN